MTEGTWEVEADALHSLFSGMSRSIGQSGLSDWEALIAIMAWCVVNGDGLTEEQSKLAAELAGGLAYQIAPGRAH